MPPIEIQTIAVLREGDLLEGQMKEVGFGPDGGKVLLSRLGNGKVHATSAFCTHNGVSLVNGTLAGDGRVMCPLHGACFNVCTGDIEDAPARGAIHSFKAEVTASHIFVTADPADTLPIRKLRPSKVQGQGYTTDGPGVVIVGGGAGALNLIESLRENGYKKLITMISSEPYAPIDRTQLSKEHITDVSKIELRSAADLEKNFGVTFRSNVTVTAIDPKAKHVKINEEKVTYEKVVLAMGGTPRRLDPPPHEMENVYTLRYVQDAKKIDAALTEGKRLVVVGSSFISMELIVAFSDRKLASIDVVSTEKYPFQRTLGDEVGIGLEKHFVKQSIKFQLGVKVTAIRPSASNPKHAIGVELEGGGFIPADTIVTGVGVIPATGFLKTSGIPLEKDGGIKVDEFLRVPNFDGVYAIGDIATYPDVSGEFGRLEHWNVASNHGRAVGRHITGKGEPFGKIPFAWSTLGHTLRYAGNIVNFQNSDVIVQGKPEELNFIAYYTKGDKVLAVASMQRDPIAAKCSELMRLGLMPLASEIKAGKDPLTIDISKVKAKADTEDITSVCANLHGA